VIAVDTSALMAIVLDEAAADDCIAILRNEPEILISAGTVVEALVVATRRSVIDEVKRLLDEFGFDVVPVTPAAARRIGAAYVRWGKGMHPAGLNFGDCFSYDVAKQHACPLLYVGDDFPKTDLTPALQPYSGRAT
jgi:ribonuclease VapC